MKLELIGTISEISRAKHVMRAIAFSADGKLLASSGSDGIIRFWDSATHKEVAQLCWPQIFLPYYSEIHSVAFSPDGKLFAACGDHGSLALFHTANLELMARFPLQKRINLSEMSVAFSPCSGYLAVVGWNNCLRIIDTETLMLIQQIKFQGWLDSVIFHPTKKLLIIGGSNFTRRLDFENTGDYQSAPKKLSLDTNKLSSGNVSFNRNGEWLAISNHDDAVRVYRTNEKSPCNTLRGHHGGSTALAWHPNNDLLITGDSVKSIYLWAGANGELLATINAHDKKVSDLCWRGDGEILASTSWDKSIKFWQLV